jgi:RNA polymerase sigma-70 factor (ECF subfamily)
VGPLTSVGDAGAAGDPQIDLAPLDPQEPGRPALDTLSAQLVASGRGDQDAFARLYDDLVPRIYGLLLRILGDAHQSEEVTQEVLLQVWQNSNRFDPQRGSALSWVMTMAHRRAVDRVRSSEAWRRRDHADAALNHQSRTDLTAEAAHASLEAGRVRAGLATLSLVQRRALELAYYGGHTHKEVARLLEVPLGTAKTRIRDGLIQLRDVMAPTMEAQT